MYENNVFINYGIIYDTKDGCIKQYRCANSMWLLYVLLFIYRVIIHRCINAPGHSRKIDENNVSEKTYLKQKIVW